MNMDTYANGSERHSAALGAHKCRKSSSNRKPPTTVVVSDSVCQAVKQSIVKTQKQKDG